MEQRLIDANALWELMRTYDDYQGAKEAHDLELIHRDSILFAIENAPTVDAVYVVRCRECKHGITGHGITDGWALCSKPYATDTVSGAMHRCDWYCADGERE